MFDQRGDLMSLNFILIGERIKLTRKHRGFAQFDLAEKVDKSPVFISYIENGLKCMSLDTFIKVANALHVSADELLQDNIENNIKIFNSEFASLISDCSEFEKRFIFETAKSIKKTMRENRYMLYRNIEQNDNNRY